MYNIIYSNKNNLPWIYRILNHIWKSFMKKTLCTVRSFLYILFVNAVMVFFNPPIKTFYILRYVSFKTIDWNPIHILSNDIKTTVWHHIEIEKRFKNSFYYFLSFSLTKGEPFLGPYLLFAKWFHSSNATGIHLFIITLNSF